MGKLTHFDEHGGGRMVDVGGKDITPRIARASAVVEMAPETLALVRDRKLAKGDVLEVARLELTPRFYYKAVPVLTPHVYRLADLTNTSELVLLPGEATMYIGTDFVGQTKLPLVAVGCRAGRDLLASGFRRSR